TATTITITITITITTTITVTATITPPSQNTPILTLRRAAVVTPSSDDPLGWQPCRRRQRLYQHPSAGDHLRQLPLPAGLPQAARRAVATLARPPSPPPPSPAPPPPPPVNNPGGECQCLGKPPAMAHSDASLSFPILSTNGTLDMGSMRISLGYNSGERGLNVATIIRSQYYFGYSPDIPTLRVGVVPAPLADASACPTIDSFQGNINPSYTEPACTRGTGSRAGRCCPIAPTRCSSGAPPRMLAVYAYVRMAMTVRGGGEEGMARKGG
ncbi:hypothetical protein PLESTM_001075200, partial [Pleodorina starrii]